MGSVEQPAPCSSSVLAKETQSSRLQIKHLPSQVSREDILPLISSFGTVLNIDIVKQSKESQACVSYESLDQAQKACESLQNFPFQGSNLKVEFVSNIIAHESKDHPQLSPVSAGRNANFVALPLRILVPSEYVGAIIGKKGQSIKTITTRCDARVDVHGKGNNDLVEKIISIYGQPENCTKACKEILQVMEHEALANVVRGEISLKMLMDDRYCSRLIGKEGQMIKKIREETGTKIVVTNAQEVIGLYPERVVCIRGAVDNLVKAEAAIYNKLVECMEQDMKTPSRPSGLMNGSSASVMPTGSYYSMAGPSGMVSEGYYPMYSSSFNQSPPFEQCQLVIPNSAVGAIIGSNGSNIKQMMRESGAFISVEHKTEGNLSASSQRTVTIKGTVDACWKGSYYVFEKMKMEGFSGNDDVRLKTIIRVPKITVGRIIGKGGKNVHEIQRLTGGIIRLPQQDQVVGDNTPVEVFGNFMATQSAHSRIRAVVHQIVQQSYSSAYCPPSYQGIMLPSSHLEQS